ncbi:MAG: hypothetical protein M1828_006029 [Chrysothrix sp. TS-e1954]|nr:MAG: hypothetical protein M1828_006029 [Chrysothrix sp. TS-e1954]
MTPNLLVWAQTAVNPRKWVQRETSSTTSPVTEHWHEPIPGTYAYTPGRGWYLIHVDENFDASLIALSLPSKQLPPLPHHVIYSRVVKRYLLECDYLHRRQLAPRQGHCAEVTMFRLDDGVAWVMLEDEKGRFNPGPWQLLCIDKETKQFRPMLKGDDPVRQSKKNTPVASPAESRRGSVQAGVDMSGHPDTVSTGAHAKYLSVKLGEAGGTRNSKSPPESGTTSPVRSMPTSSKGSPKSSFETQRS